MEVKGESDELGLVIDEITKAMSARAAALTLHPSGGEAATLIYVDPSWPSDDAARIVERASAYVATDDSEHSWHPQAGSRVGVLHVPVTRVPGHGRLVISVFFDLLTNAAQREAEAVYLARRPFAVGYFRLWQLARQRVRYGAALEMVLNLAESAVFLLDRTGNIAFANDAAAAILSVGDGLRRQNGSVRATHLADGVRLQMALDYMTAANGDDTNEVLSEAAKVLALRRKAGPPLIASIIATDMPASEPSDVAAILYVVDPKLDSGELLAPVCRLYQLSPVETGIVCHLAAGRTVQTLSGLMRIKEQTARSYLKQIFLKTSTNRQTELVVLMLSSLIRMKHSVMQEPLVENGASEIRMNSM